MTLSGYISVIQQTRLLTIALRIYIRTSAALIETVLTELDVRTVDRTCHWTNRVQFDLRNHANNKRSNYHIALISLSSSLLSLLVSVLAHISVTLFDACECAVMVG